MEEEINIDDYVEIIEDNNPDHRYDGKKGKVVNILPDPATEENPLYLVEVDINSGDKGTCVAKTVKLVS